MKGLEEIAVQNGRLVKPARFDKKLLFDESPNQEPGLEAKYLIIHYTAGPSALSAVSTFKSRPAQASAHLVIDRNGDITQMVPFDRIAYHAGQSYWDGLHNLNKHSIGIELVNAGRLKKLGNSWIPWYSKNFNQKDVVLDTHKFDKTEYGWQPFTEEQLEVAVAVSSILFNEFHLLDVLGHDDISPRRKWDPGPAFPMDSFRSRIVGRSGKESAQHVITEATQMKQISNPEGNSSGDVVDIPKGSNVEVLERTAFDVHIVVTEGNNFGKSGWVSNRAVRRLLK